MSDDDQVKTVSAEPVFRSAKRRKILRKRVSDLEVESRESNTVLDNDPTPVVARRRPVIRNTGVIFSTTPRGITTPVPTGTSEETAVLPYTPDVADQVQNERFMKPTGKAGVVEDKHMVAYVDSKLAELRSWDAQTGPQSQDNDGSRRIEQPQKTVNRAVHGDVEEVEVSSKNLRGRTGLYTRQPARPRRRQPVRGEDDIARDALVDQIMKESQVTLYDLPQSSQQFKRGDGSDEDEQDNDTAAAEAFKAQYMAQQEAQQRRRPPPPPAGKGAVAVSSGPKLGGSRAQREKMKAIEEANKGGVKKK